MTPAPDHVLNVGLERRKMVLGLLFGASAFVAAWRTPGRDLDYLGKAKLDSILPKAIGPWKFVSSSGLVVPPEDQLSLSLYSNLLTRVYWDEHSSPIMLLIAQSKGQTGILQVHRPEVCYPASGYQLSPVSARDIDLNGRKIPTNRLTATMDGQQEHILYWTRIGDDMPQSWRDQRLSVAKQNLEGIVPDAILFRLSVRSMDAASAFATMEQFVREMVAAIPAAQQRILIA